jgi:hypothetical protein
MKMQSRKHSSRPSDERGELRYIEKEDRCNCGIVAGSRAFTLHWLTAIEVKFGTQGN